jgi:hypothetical protein
MFGSICNLGPFSFCFFRRYAICKLVSLSDFCFPVLFLCCLSPLFLSIAGMYNAELKNFMTYLVDGFQHCFTNHELYYDADAMGPNDAGATNSGLMLSDWTNIVPLADGETQNTVCEGAVQAGDKAKKTVKQDDNSYCSSNVIPKAFTEAY